MILSPKIVRRVEGFKRKQTFPKHSSNPKAKAVI